MHTFITRHLTLIGSLGALLGSLMMLSQIEVIQQNMTGAVDIWILPFFALLNSLLWLAYAYGIRKKEMMVPNVVGILISLAAMLSAFIY